eukprot:TRINITY_DN17322_c0_g1_i1.p1 TRINITY_DN17322_c0_g1~~TRINITY_DN17322_c0_g1_i1.p1  ORF type:complete len:428 (-),score=21.44 TRINITY_DN17322_c0_g1_i1:51-1334(-)
MQEGAMTASASAQLCQRRVLLTLLLATASLNNLICPATASPPVCDAVVDPDTGEFRDSSAPDCTPNPCLAPLNPCGPGNCTYDASGGSTHHYTCACPRDSSAPGSFVNGAPTCTTGGSDGSRTYTVKQGDQCLGIAVNNSLVLRGLQALNPDINCSALSAGQILDLGNYIPNGKCGRLYTVLAGETCERLRAAARMNTSEFVDLNGEACNALRFGSQVCVARNPSVASMLTLETRTRSCPISVRSATNDRCMSFALANNIKVADLVAWNPDKKLDCRNNMILKSDQYCITKPKPYRFRPEQIWARNTRDGGVVFEDVQGLFENDSGLLEGGEELLGGGEELFENGERDGEGLPEDEGEVIIVDEGTVCDVAYAARHGDTCESIRARFDVSEAEFLRLNPRLSCDLLQIGGKVCVQVPPEVAGGMDVL